VVLLCVMFFFVFGARVQVGADRFYE